MWRVFFWAIAALRFAQLPDVVAEASEYSRFPCAVEGKRFKSAQRVDLSPFKAGSARLVYPAGQDGG
ncbi:hypothetical protein C8024_09880 [Sphingopyxis sp. BSNA05]|nr:hypothetical protein [Sphingopyxis sp. BSNA05]